MADRNEEGAAMSQDISKVNVTKNAEDKYEVEIEYKDKDGKVTNGETKVFDDFSQASAWVANIEVELHDDNALQTPPVDHTENL